MLCRGVFQLNAHPLFWHQHRQLREVWMAREVRVVRVVAVNRALYWRVAVRQAPKYVGLMRVRSAVCLIGRGQCVGRIKPQHYAARGTQVPR
jgi:hypothetical protein